MASDPFELSGKVIEAAMRVHTELGPGLLESTYEACLAEELRCSGHSVRAQVPVPVVYRGIVLENGYRLDLLVDDEIVVELKSVERLAPVHSAQLLTYLRLSGLHIGLLINFHTAHLRQGIRRMVNGYGPEATAVDHSTPSSSVPITAARRSPR